MALTKETVTDKIEVLEKGQIQVRTATRVLEDGAVLSSSFHRHVLVPADDLTNEDPKVENQ